MKKLVIALLIVMATDIHAAGEFWAQPKYAADLLLTPHVRDYPIRPQSNKQTDSYFNGLYSGFIDGLIAGANCNMNGDKFGEAHQKAARWVRDNIVPLYKADGTEDVDLIRAALTLGVTNSYKCKYPPEGSPG